MDGELDLTGGQEYYLLDPSQAKFDRWVEYASCQSPEMTMTSGSFVAYKGLAEAPSEALS